MKRNEIQKTKKKQLLQEEGRETEYVKGRDL